VGPLTLPLAGLVYIDASGLIYSVERIEPYRTLVEPMWLKAQDGNLTIVSSPLLALEALVKPIRDGNTEIESQYRELFASNAVRLLEASYEVFEDAASIRAETRLKTPDAIHAATAMRAECALFITNDTDFRRVEGLPVVVLDDLLMESSQA
jgi:predicted nucleic acid-binding protein